VTVSEIAASQRGGVGERLAQLERRHGRSACGRRALERTPSIDAALDRMLAAPPDRVGDASVREVNVHDGLRLSLDDGFVMLRRSGTEPVVRLYAEAAGPRRLARRIGQVETILRAAQRDGS